jgi:outer membrane lipopolysaccharide assembly protein LptE/RlpB
MKKSILLAALLLATTAMLAGCGHPFDITENLAAAAAAADQA